MFITVRRCERGFIISQYNAIITRAPPSYLDVNAVERTLSEAGAGVGAVADNNDHVLSVWHCF